MSHASGSSHNTITAGSTRGSHDSPPMGLYLNHSTSALTNMTMTAPESSHNHMLPHETTGHGYLPHTNGTVGADSGHHQPANSHAPDLHGLHTVEHGEHSAHAVETTTMRDLSDALAILREGGKLPTIRLSNESVLYGILVVLLAQAVIIMLLDAYVMLFFATRASRQRHWYHHTSVRQMLLGMVTTALSAVVASVFDICRIIALADDDVTLCRSRGAHNNSNSSSTYHFKTTTISPVVAAGGCGASAPSSTFPTWLFRTLFYILRCFQLALFTLIPLCAFHKYQLFEYSAYGRLSEHGQHVMQALRGGTAQPTTYDNERVFSRHSLAMKQFFPAIYAIVVGIVVAVVIQIERGAVGVTGELDNLWPFITTTPYIWVPDSHITGDGPHLVFSWYLYTFLFYVVPLIIAVVVDRLLFSHQVYAEIRLHEMVTAPTAAVVAAAAADATGKPPPPAPKKGERPEDKLREHIFDASSVRRQHAAAFFLAWIVPVVHDTVNHFQHADQKLDVLANVEWGWQYELPSLVLLCISQYMFLCFAIFSLQFVHGLPIDVASQTALATVKKTQ